MWVRVHRKLSNVTTPELHGRVRTVQDLVLVIGICNSSLKPCKYVHNKSDSVRAEEFQSAGASRRSIPQPLCHYCADSSSLSRRQGQLCVLENIFLAPVTSGTTPATHCTRTQLSESDSQTRTLHIEDTCAP
jgi:hypothetical protein